MEVSEKSKDIRKQRRDFVKTFIYARKKSRTFTSLDREFEALAGVLFVSKKTVEKDYYE